MIVNVGNTERFKKYISDTLRDIRMDRGFTWNQISNLDGVHARQVSKVERGEKFPSIDMLLKLLNLYGYELELNIKKKSAKFSDNNGVHVLPT